MIVSAELTVDLMKKNDSLGVFSLLQQSKGYQMTNMMIVTTSKEGKERITVIVLDKIQGFQRDDDRLNIFVEGTIFSVSQDLDQVWLKLVSYFNK